MLGVIYIYCSSSSSSSMIIIITTKTLTKSITYYDPPTPYKSADRGVDAAEVGLVGCYVP